MSQALVDHDLWTRIEPLLPKRRPHDRQHAGRRPIPDRAVLTGILFVLRSSIPWLRERTLGQHLREQGEKN